MIAARAVSGEVALYPLAENRHREGILLTSEVPAADVSPETQAQATHIAHRLLEHWSYVGVLSIELFDEGGSLRVNELAPRVHNSGHWSQDAGVTSQFSNHIRAITDTRPGATQPHCYAGMLNLLGRTARYGAPAVKRREPALVHKVGASSSQSRAPQCAGNRSRAVKEAVI